LAIAIQGSVGNFDKQQQIGWLGVVVEIVIFAVSGDRDIWFWLPVWRNFDGILAAIAPSDTKSDVHKPTKM
jgi:hypothetical protein